MKSWVLLLLASTASAHVLTESTAVVTLRDGHLEVSADFDVFLLAGFEPTEAATAPEAALVAMHAQLRQLVETQTVLNVDGARQALRLREFLSPTDLRVVAATLSGSGRSHGVLVRLKLEPAGLFPAASAVSLALPNSLGPTVISLVQPRTQYAAPGQAAVFSVRPPTETLPASALSVSGGVWFALAMVGLVLAAGWAHSKRLVSSPPSSGS